MCTYNGYYTTFDEKERGSLETGKTADMVVLSENPYAVPLPELKRLKVQKLMLDGKEYNRQTGGAVRMICRGLVSKEKI
jgi:predicted amidohydrolase YtcJ